MNAVIGTADKHPSESKQLCRIEWQAEVAFEVTVRMHENGSDRTDVPPGLAASGPVASVVPGAGSRVVPFWRGRWKFRLASACL